MRDFGEHSPRFCSEERATGGNPARGIKKPPIRKMERFLSDDEIARLSAALEFEATSSGNPYASAAIKLLLLTGCRRGEILNLSWKHVDLERQCLRLPDSKTGAKVVYLNAPALELLRRLPHIAGNSYVIAGSKDASPLSGLDRSGTGCASPQDSAMSAYMIFATVLQASEY